MTMGKALYRTYRSRRLDEIVGQEHITTALTQALKQGTVSHAYLFTGPRGVGKTSVARILAHEINHLPYDDETNHLDIIEIDAASNRRIDEIRELRERVNNAPTSAQYKVYIIDEVHMLTREAFNALLKTLEEPPAHVIFILATTEAHKLPQTIISRTQRFSFKPIQSSKVVEHLKTIAKSEKITVDDDALDLIAQHGEGSFRDSISLLDQVRNTNSHVTRDDVLTLLGQAPEELIQSLLQTVKNQDLASTITTLQTARDQGFEAASLAKQLTEVLQHSLLSGQLLFSTTQALLLLHDLIEVGGSPEPYIALQIALLTSANTVAEPSRNSRDTPETAGPKHEIRPGKTSKLAVPNDITDTTSDVSSQTDNQLWSQVLTAIKSKHNTLYGVLRMASPEFQQNTLILTFAFAFHQKRINDDSYREIVRNTVQKISGRTLKIEGVVRNTSMTPDTMSPTKIDVTIDNISNIFGGAELLES